MNYHQVIHSKIVMSPNALRSILDERAIGRSIVLTKGVYDLFHVGHLQSLIAAHTFGDILVVGVNSDEAVRTRKGIQRPILDQKSRMLLLAGLVCVDWVTLDQDTLPVELINAVNPDVFAISQPYLASLSATELQSIAGVKVITIPEFVDGWSTTRIVERIKRLGTSGT